MILLAAGDTLAASASAASAVTSTVFGMERSGGVETYKVLDQRQLAATPGTIYTAPASTEALIQAISIVNCDTVLRTVKYYRGGTGLGNLISQIIYLQAGGMALYEDVQGWQVFNKTGQLLVGAGTNPVEGFYNFSPGMLGETFDRNQFSETNVAAVASGTLRMQALWLTAGTLVRYISFHSATTGLAANTSWRFGLYDASRNLLATTPDQGAAVWAAQTLRTLAVTTPYIIPTNGLYYLANYFTGSGTKCTLKGNVAKTQTELTGQAPILQGTSTTGITDTLPNPAAAITVTTTSMWGAVS